MIQPGSCSNRRSNSLYLSCKLKKEALADGAEWDKLVPGTCLLSTSVSTTGVAAKRPRETLSLGCTFPASSEGDDLVAQRHLCILA